MILSSFTKPCKHRNKPILEHFHPPIRSLPPFYIHLPFHLQLEATTNVPSVSKGLPFLDILGTWNDTIGSFLCLTSFT